ncbi:hypothetical protein LguiB_006292 [Lonicera macranthoides]
MSHVGDTSNTAPIDGEIPKSTSRSKGSHKFFGVLGISFSGKSIFLSEVGNSSSRSSSPFTSFSSIGVVLKARGLALPILKSSVLEKERRGDYLGNTVQLFHTSRMPLRIGLSQSMSFMWMGKRVPQMFV